MTRGRVVLVALLLCDGPFLFDPNRSWSMTGVKADCIITTEIALDFANVRQLDSALVSIVCGPPGKWIGRVLTPRAGKKAREEKRDQRAKSRNARASNSHVEFT